MGVYFVSDSATAELRLMVRLLVFVFVVAEGRKERLKELGWMDGIKVNCRGCTVVYTLRST